MSQRELTFPGSPLTGTDMLGDIQEMVAALASNRSGTSRPSDIQTGEIWLDTTSATAQLLKFWDGTDDITLATINATTNAVVFTGAALAGANSDITSLSGLTTPLSVAQGGTGGAVGVTALRVFGATGDGTTDDSGAIATALAAGVKLTGEGLTYAVGSALTATIAFQLEHATLKRTGAVASILVVNSPSAVLETVVFDGNSGSVSSGCNLVTVQDACTSSRFVNCTFKNAKANAGYGAGLVYNVATRLTDQHIVEDCYATLNDSHGLAVYSATNLTIRGGSFLSNAGSGIWANNYYTATDRKINGLKVHGARCMYNGAAGLVVGDIIEDDNISSGYRLYSHTYMEAADAEVIGGEFAHNVQYGIAMFSERGRIEGATVVSNGSGGGGTGSGIVCCGLECIISGNTIKSNNSWGLDMGFSYNALVTGNEFVSNGVTAEYPAINVGGTVYGALRGNVFRNNNGSTGYQIVVHGPDSDGSSALNSISYLTTQLTIAGNIFQLGTTHRAVIFNDNPSLSAFVDNTLIGGNIPYAIVAIGSNVLVSGNKRPTTGAETILALSSGDRLIVPEGWDFVALNTATTVAGILPASMDVVGVSGVAWITVTAGGSGYTSVPTVEITGDGSGAAAVAFVYKGVVVGVRVTAYGTGYTTATVAITGGGGSGATATAQVGVPMPTGKRLKIYSYQATTITRAPAGTPAIGPMVENVSGADTAVSAKQVINLVSLSNRWNVE